MPGAGFLIGDGAGAGEGVGDGITEEILGWRRGRTRRQSNWRWSTVRGASGSGDDCARVWSYFSFSNVGVDGWNTVDGGARLWFD
jgi:hypothetical protein